MRAANSLVILVILLGKEGELSLCSNVHAGHTSFQKGNFIFPFAVNVLKQCYADGGGRACFPRELLMSFCQTSVVVPSQAVASSSTCQI